MSQRPKVLIAAWYRWPTAARLAAALVSCGVRVDVLCPAFHPLLAVDGVAERHRFALVAPASSLRYALERSEPALVIPCDDFTLRELERLRLHGPDAVSSLVNRVASPASAFDALVSRASLIEAAVAADVRCPPTARVADAAASARWVDEQGGPAFLKVDGTFGGSGVREAPDAAGASAMFQTMARPPSLLKACQHLVRRQEFSKLRAWRDGSPAAVTLQKSVAGVPANCSAFAWRGEVHAVVSVEVLRTETKLGVATLVRAVDHPEMASAARAIARTLQLTGIFGLDFIWDRERDLTWLIELNPRPTPISHMTFGPGRDLAAAVAGVISAEQAPAERAPLPLDRPIALFPRCLSEDTRAAGAFEDIPTDQPRLVRALAPTNTRSRSSAEVECLGASAPA